MSDESRTALFSLSDIARRAVLVYDPRDLDAVLMMGKVVEAAIALGDASATGSDEERLSAWNALYELVERFEEAK